MTNTRKTTQKKDSGGGYFDALMEHKRTKLEQEFKVQEANMKMKGELMKAILPKLIEQKMAQQSPQQQHFKNLVARENPIIAMMGDQSGAPQGGGQVEFDPSINEAQPTMNEKGLYEQKPQGREETEDRKAQAFLSMSENLIKEGKTLPPWMMKARENAQGRMGKRLGYEESSGAKPKTVSDWSGYIKPLQENRHRTPEQDMKLEYAQKQLDRLMFGDSPERSMQGMGEQQTDLFNQEPPAQQQQQEQDPLEGKTAINQQTKQRLVRRNGQWVSIQQ